MFNATVMLFLFVGKWLGKEIAIASQENCYGCLRSRGFLVSVAIYRMQQGLMQGLHSATNVP